MSKKQSAKKVPLGKNLQWLNDSSSHDRILSSDNKIIYQASQSNKATRICVRKIIMKDDLNNAKIIDDGTDEFTISESVSIIEFYEKLTPEEAKELNEKLNEEDMELIMDKNGNVKYFD